MLSRILILFLITKQLSALGPADLVTLDVITITQVLLNISLSVSPKCNEQLRTFTEAFTAKEEWTFRMLDAMAKPQSGILFGNIMHVGNYDECLEIGKSFGNTNVRGKYCSALFTPHPKYGNWVADIFNEIEGGNTKIEENHFATTAKKSYGFCVPKECTAADLQFLANYIEEDTKSPLHFVFVDDFCDSGDGLPFTPAAIVAICIFAVFAIIMVCSTLYDVLYFQENGGKHPNLLVAFSLLTNGKKLLSTDTAEGTLNCLNGLRVISMMWILQAHRFMYQFFVPEINPAYVLEWRNATTNSFIAATSMAVDTFFVVSGLLVVYLYLKSRDKNVRFSLPMFYLHRIIRLTPSLAMVVLLSATLIKYMGSGPFWPVVDEMFQKPCERSWWSSLIYLQNYIHTHDQCVGQAWYLSVDTQMYFLSPLIFVPMVRWPKQTIIAIGVFVVLNCCYVFEITWKKNLGSMFFDQDDTQYAYIYSPTHVRGTVYLVGMVCGYLVYKTRKSPPVLSRIKVLSLWTVSLLILLGITISHTHFFKYKTTVLENAFFNSLTRVGWGIALSVIILLCVNGYGGLINDFLSSRIFVFLIRVNYNVYLLHLLIMVAIVAQNKTPGYFSNMFTFHLFWGDYIFSVAASTLWSLAFESPILVIEKIIFGRPKEKPIILT